MFSIIFTGILFCLTITTEAQVKLFEFEGDLFAEETHNPTNIKYRQVPVGKSNLENPIYIQKIAADGLGGGSTIAIPVIATSSNHLPSDQSRSFGSIIRTKKLLFLKFAKLLPAGIPLLTAAGLPLLSLPILLRSSDGTEIPINNIDDIQIIEVPEEVNKVVSSVPAPASKSSGLINGSNARSNLKERSQKVIVLDNIEFPKINLPQQSAVNVRNLQPGKTHSRFVSILRTQNRKVTSP